MNLNEIIDRIQQFDKNKDVVLQNSFDYDVNYAKIVNIYEKDGKIVLKMCPYNILLDIGAFCMLKKKEILLDDFLTNVSEIIQNSSSFSKEQLVQKLKEATTIKMEDVDKCVPSIL